jgi:hypothetical protein
VFLHHHDPTTDHGEQKQSQRTTAAAVPIIIMLLIPTNCCIEDQTSRSSLQLQESLKQHQQQPTPDTSVAVEAPSASCLGAATGANNIITTTSKGS